MRLRASSKARVDFLIAEQSFRQHPFTMSQRESEDEFKLQGVLPPEDDFAREAAEYPVVPVWVELVADSETPLSLLSKLSSEETSFLLESAEQSDLVGRYSFVGCGSRAMISSQGDTVTLTDRNGLTKSWRAADPLRELEALMLSLIHI